MPINSRDKGAVGERELAAYLRERGYEAAKRGQQFRGGSDSPDCLGLPGIHIECKRVERVSLYDWLDQAVLDAGVSSNIPVVMHRRNKPGGKAVTTRGEWVAILRLNDFLGIIGSVPSGEEY